MNKVRFTEMLKALASIFRITLEPITVKIYWNIMKRYTDKQITKAISIAAENCKFFPRPVELIEFIEGNKESKALFAWQVFREASRKAAPYSSVLFEDGRIAETIRIMGGWVRVSDWPEKELDFRRNEFIKIYMSLPEQEPEAVVGLHDRNNTRLGYENSDLYIAEKNGLIRKGRQQIKDENSNKRKLADLIEKKFK